MTRVDLEVAVVCPEVDGRADTGDAALVHLRLNQQGVRAWYSLVRLLPCRLPRAPRSRTRDRHTSSNTRRTAESAPESGRRCREWKRSRQDSSCGAVLLLAPRQRGPASPSARNLRGPRAANRVSAASAMRTWLRELTTCALSFCSSRSSEKEKSAMLGVGGSRVRVVPSAKIRSRTQTDASFAIQRSRGGGGRRWRVVTARLRRVEGRSVSGCAGAED